MDWASFSKHGFEYSKPYKSTSSTTRLRKRKAHLIYILIAIVSTLAFVGHFMPVKRPLVSNRTAFKPLTTSSAFHKDGLPFARPHPPGWNSDPMDYPKPRTFFDIEIDGKYVGRIEFELYTKQSPRAAENFRVLCTGQNGTVPDLPGREGAGMRLHFKGHEFYRVIDQFICQTGVNTESVYGGMFKDDEGGLLLRHTKKGLLSMANMGPDTNTAHFSILMGPAPHLDGHYTIFGEVVAGLEVVDMINALAKPTGSPDERPRLPVKIVDSGELPQRT